MLGKGAYGIVSTRRSCDNKRSIRLISLGLQQQLQMFMRSRLPSHQVYCGLTSHGQLIAVKQVSLDASDPDAAEGEYARLQGEVELLKTLRHANIVGFLGTSFHQQVVSIFMEYIPGGSIASILHRWGFISTQRLLELLIVTRL